jgi:hypothetical protein
MDFIRLAFKSTNHRTPDAFFVIDEKQFVHGCSPELHQLTQLPGIQQGKHIPWK